MLKRTIVTAVVALLLGTSSIAWAGSDSSELRDVSVTISPAHLAMPALSDNTQQFSPFVELTGEFRVIDQVGVAGIVGYGHSTATFLDEKLNINMLEFGAQGRWYPVGDFDHGMQLGLEVLYAAAFTDGDINGIQVGGTARGLNVGPFIGYKIAADIGFTFEIQAGAAYNLVSARSTADTGSTTARARDRNSRFLPIINLGLGWSF